MAAPPHSVLSLDADDAGARWIAPYADVLRASLAEGRSVRLGLSGISMRPTIPDGAAIVVAACAAPRIRRGDVVVHVDAGRLICHRVLGRRWSAQGDAFLTKGDAAAALPLLVPASSVIGRVVGVDVGGRRVRTDTRAARVRALAAVLRSWSLLRARALLRGLRRPIPARRGA